MSEITVGIPIHKEANPAFFKLAIESIINQTLKPKVIQIIQDGELTEQLESIIENYLKSHSIHLIKFENNNGLAYILNESIKRCKTTFYARMDSDDISLPGRFEKQKAFLEKNEDILLVGGAINEINDSGKIIGYRKYPKTTKEAKLYIPKASPFAHPTIMFRRSLLKEDILYNPEIKVSQDIDLWFRILKKNYKVANLEDVVMLYRRSSEFYNRRGFNKSKKEFLIYFRGILDLYGISFKLIYPVIRLFTRLIPGNIKKFVYSKSFRSFLNS